MKEVFDKIIGFIHSEIARTTSYAEHDIQINIKFFVEQLRDEYNNGWIPCSERLPSEATVYEVTEEIVLCSKKQYIVEHRLFGTEGEWLCPSNRKVIAWQPLPKPYQPKGE